MKYIDDFRKFFIFKKLSNSHFNFCSLCKLFMLLYACILKASSNFIPIKLKSQNLCKWLYNEIFNFVDWWEQIVNNVSKKCERLKKKIVLKVLISGSSWHLLHYTLKFILLPIAEQRKKRENEREKGKVNFIFLLRRVPFLSFVQFSVASAERSSETPAI